jgi:hypothetical protein
VLKREDGTNEIRLDAINKLLSVLSNQNDKHVAIYEGIIPAIHNGLKGSWMEEKELIKCAADVIGQISLALPGRNAMGKADTVKLLTNLLTHDSHTVREAVASAFKSLSIFHDGVTLIVKGTGTVSTIVDSLIDKESKTVTSKLVYVCENITNFALGLERAVQTGMIGKLLQLLETPTFTEELYTECMKAVWNISNDELGRNMAIEYGAVNDICLLIEKYTASSDEFKRTASGALLAMAHQLEGREHILQHGVKILSSMVYSSCKDVARNAMAAIVLTSNVEKCKFAFVRALVPRKDKLIEVFQEKAAQQLNELLLDADPYTRMHACDCLIWVASNDGGPDYLHTCLYIVENLSTLLYDDVPNSREFAFKVLSLMRGPITTSKLNKALASDVKLQAAFTNNAAFAGLL